jgi:single-stranded-DNA-specific exonuclease
VVVSIASDIVPITGENRIMAHYGLKKLNERPSMGLKAIKEVAGIDKEQIDMEDIVFKIGPRINAAGRMESGKKSVDLLVCEKAGRMPGSSVKRSTVLTWIAGTSIRKLPARPSK